VVISEREDDKPDNEHAAAAKQISGPPAEDQQAAERDGIPGDDPLHDRGGDAKVTLDRRERDVHDGEIDE
jgi:hypothetical protein